MPPTTGGHGMAPRQWWRRAAAAVKDKRSLCLARLGPLSARRWRGNGGGGSAGLLLFRHHPDLEAAVIKATSHDETGVDYKNAGRVFAWARTSPAAFLRPLMWALSRRVEKTRSWAVALKTLMLAHGVILCSSSAAAAAAAVGRLPFDLSGFRDRSSWGFSAFVRAYFNFLDQRSAFLSSSRYAGADDEEEVVAGGGLRRLERMQDLLELLMQVRPYGDQGARAGLVLEAMDCVVVEIFEVYSAICNGIACSLVGIFGSSSSSRKEDGGIGEREKEREKGMLGIRVLRRAAEQSSQLSSYFELCRDLGVLNAADLPAVERISEEDIRDLESLVLGDFPGRRGVGASEEEEKILGGEEEGKRGISGNGSLRTVVTEEWVVFEEEWGVAEEGRFGNNGTHSTNPFLVGPETGLWELRHVQQPISPLRGNNGLIGLDRRFGPDPSTVLANVSDPVSLL